MAPSCRVVVFSLVDAEVVTSYVDLLVSSLFQGHVEGGFDSKVVAPADPMTLTVRTSPHSLVGVLSIDKSVTILAGNSQFQESSIEGSYSSFSPISPVTSSGYWWNSAPVSAQDVLSNSGLLFLTNAQLPSSLSDFPPVFDMPEDEMGMPENGAENPNEDDHNRIEKPSAPSKLRSFFPETWLWQTGVSNGDGEVSFLSSELI